MWKLLVLAYLVFSILFVYNQEKANSILRKNETSIITNLVAWHNPNFKWENFIKNARIVILGGQMTANPQNLEALLVSPVPILIRAENFKLRDENNARAIEATAKYFGKVEGSDELTLHFILKGGASEQLPRALEQLAGTKKQRGISCAIVAKILKVEHRGRSKDTFDVHGEYLSAVPFIDAHKQFSGFGWIGMCVFLIFWLPIIHLIMFNIFANSFSARLSLEKKHPGISTKFFSFVFWAIIIYVAIVHYNENLSIIETSLKN